MNTKSYISAFRFGTFPPESGSLINRMRRSSSSAHLPPSPSALSVGALFSSLHAPLENEKKR
ncbi:MAG TPA: hypothetical protein HA306_09980 [Methanosarcina sp.]|nr:hypothetical protein [Methanosarcina sp.]